MLSRGKIPSPKEILGIRELSRDDLQQLRQPRQLSVIQRIRDPHHLLARLLASGLKIVDAAARSGYSYNSAWRLTHDPSFKQLVAEYRNEINAQWLESVDEFAQTSVSNMMKAERMIAEQLDAADEEGNLPSIKVLASITADRADRFGYGKKQTNINVNVDFAAKLERATKRSAAVIDSSPVVTSDVPPVRLPAPAGDRSPPNRQPADPQPFRESVRRRA